jgi:hypothetical protein
VNPSPLNCGPGCWPSGSPCTLRCTQFLSGHLRAGLTVEQAAQRYCALLSPELHHLLTSELGWRADHHREWVSALLERDLLTDP